MPKTTWTILLEDKTHRVLLEHGLLSGKRQIYLDDILVEQGRKLFDYGSNHQVNIDGHPYQLDILYNGLKYHYVLHRDGRAILSDQDLAKGKPSLQVQHDRLIGDLDFWTELGRELGLPLIPGPDASAGKLNQRLLGYREGCLVIVRKQIIFQPAADVWIVQVHHAPQSSPAVSKQIQTDKRIKKMLGKYKQQKSFFETAELDTHILLPWQKNEQPAALARRVRDFLALTAEYVRPPVPERCDNPDCAQPHTSERRLVLINGLPRLLCPACADSLPFIFARDEETYHARPGNLPAGIAAGTGVALLGALGCAALGLIWPGMQMLASIIILFLITGTMNRIGAKPTLASRVAALLLALLSALLGNWAWAFLYDIRLGAPASLPLLAENWAYILNSPILRTAVTINLLYGGILIFTTWNGYRDALKGAFHPKIETLPGIY